MTTPALQPSAAPQTRAANAWTARDILSVLAIPIVVSLLYRKTVFAPFIFDDRATVTGNWFIQVGAWRTLVLFSTRPLLALSYAFTYAISGKAPWAHHVGNILIHAANGLLVYAWIRLTLSLPRFSQRYRSPHWPALLVALLFSVHPLQTEVVAYVSGRGDALEGFFILVAMTALALALRAESRRRRAPAWRAVAAIGVLGAVLSKETGAVGPLLLLVFDCIAGGRSPGQVLRRHWLLYGVLASGWIVPAWMLWAFPWYAETAGLSFARSQFGVSVPAYAYTQPGVILHYLRLSVLPVGLTFDYEWPLAASVFAPSVLLPGLALIALLGSAIAAWNRAPLYAFAVLWFFITLAPTSSVIPIADVIAERRMYLPLLAVLLIATLAMLLAIDGIRALVARRFASSRLIRGVAGGLTLVALAACSVLTWQRNLLWCDPVAFWEDSASKAPDNPRVLANLGVQHVNRGQVALGRLELQRAAELYSAGGSHAFPRIAAFIYTHLAWADLRLADIDRARSAYQAALTYGAEGYDFLQPRLKRIRETLARLDRVAR